MFTLTLSSKCLWGRAKHRGSIRTSHPVAHGSNLGAPEFFNSKSIERSTKNVAKKSGQQSNTKTLSQAVKILGKSVH